MNEAEMDFAAEALPAKPTARQYYVWQFAMWAIILHTVLVLSVLACGMAFSSRFEKIPRRFQLHRWARTHVQLARALQESPELGLAAGLLLAPVAVITCYRKSVNKRAWGWLLSYWLAAGTALGLMVSASFILVHEFVSSFGHYGMYDEMWWRLWWGEWLKPSLVSCILYFAPLPVTLLAALLTIGAGRKRKRPAVAEVAP